MCYRQVCVQPKAAIVKKHERILPEVWLSRALGVMSASEAVYFPFAATGVCCFVLYIAMKLLSS